MQQTDVTLIENQLRATGIDQPWILEAFRKTPRDIFIPEKYQHFVGADIDIPIGANRLMLAPSQLARILQTCCYLTKNHTVLIIGTDLGYFSALVAHACRYVTLVDTDTTLLQHAKKNLKCANIHNIRLIQTSDVFEIDTYAPNLSYDTIIFTGSVLAVPSRFYNHVNMDGCIIAPLGSQSFVQMSCFRRESQDHYALLQQFETSLPPLITEQRESFIF